MFFTSGDVGDASREHERACPATSAELARARAEADLDRVRGEIAAAHLVLDRAGVGTSSLASRVEMLAKHRDDLLGAKGHKAVPRVAACVGRDVDVRPGEVTWRDLISELGELILTGDRSSVALDQPVVLRIGLDDGPDGEFVIGLLASVGIEYELGFRPAIVMRATRVKVVP
jgi:hypothetical protein